MSKEKRRVPKLRFPGFTEDWEQRKLGEFTNQINTFVNPEDAKLPLWSLTAEAGLIEKTDRYERDFLVKKKDQFKRIENNTLVYNPMNITIGSIDIYTGLYPIAVSGYYVSIVYDKNIDTDFLKEVLLLPSSLKMYKNYATGSLIERQRVQYPTFSKLQLLFPNPDEQRAIGQLFKSLNLNITLHQRKLEHLNLKKKALLQKLFPKDGERYPELRFPGFTDAWEQRKLSELATMNARIGWQNLRTSEFLDSGDYLLITGTDFDNGRIKYGTCHYVEKKRFDQDTKIQLSTGSILITKDGTLGKVALVEELPKPATLNAGVFNVRVKDDAVLSYKYLYHYLKAPFLMKYVTANATGGTIKHLNQSILVDFPIPITEKLEQDRIAKLLDSLELSITLHQRKLEDLQLQKKALLQQMFV